MSELKPSAGESNPVKVLVVGCGRMGISHAKAYCNNPGFKLVGAVSRSMASIDQLRDAVAIPDLPARMDLSSALDELMPDAVCIATYPETHASFSLAALRKGAHVFVEKPLAPSVEEAQEVIAAARENGKKLVVGYILRHHPSWTRFVELAQTLGKPLVLRMNLNQQSFGEDWRIHLNLMRSMSPIVDCGVHYIDVMCQITGARPQFVHAIGARLSAEISPGQVNYGQLQVGFSDGSVGWYEAGWGPMMSQEAFFVKDVIGPRGAVSLVATKIAEQSGEIEGHTKTGAIRLHHAPLGADGKFLKADELIDTSNEPDHDALCALEQDFFLQSIRGDISLDRHLEDAIRSLQVVLAADRSIHEGCRVNITDL